MAASKTKTVTKSQIYQEITSATTLAPSGPMAVQWLTPAGTGGIWKLGGTHEKSRM